MAWQDRVTLAKATYAPLGVGNFNPGVTLLIGEQSSRPTEAPEQLPFCSDRGCSGWLNKQLEQSQVDESRLFWVNALNNDGSPIQLKQLLEGLKPSKVIALGNVAEKLCRDEEVDYIKAYHPQYWKRFKSKHRYPLLDLLS